MPEGIRTSRGVASWIKLQSTRQPDRPPTSEQRVHIQGLRALDTSKDNRAVPAAIQEYPEAAEGEEVDQGPLDW